MSKQKNDVCAREVSSVFQSKEERSMQIRELCLLEECKPELIQKTKEFYKKKAETFLAQQISKAFERFEKYLVDNNGLIEIADGIFYLKAIHAIFPDPEKWEHKTMQAALFAPDYFNSDFGPYKGTLIHREELKELHAKKMFFKKITGFFAIFDNEPIEHYADWIKSLPNKTLRDAMLVAESIRKHMETRSGKRLTFINFESPSYNEYSYTSMPGCEASFLPVFRLGEQVMSKVSNLDVFCYFLLDENTLKNFEYMNTARESYQKFKAYIKLNDGTIAFETEAFVKDFEKGTLSFDLNGKGEQTIQQMIDDLLNGGDCPKELFGCVSDSLKEFYLTSDARLVQLEPYGEDLLFEHTQGHWDLVTKAVSNNKVVLPIDPPFYARNPYQDIQRGSLIGIDFGTKSTVVSCLDKRSQIFAIPVGKQGVEISEEGTDGRKDFYENPTIMHFCNLDTFMKAYRNAKGRPETTWKDLAVAHTALSQLSEANDANYYSFISNLKQWAASGEKMRLIDANGAEKEIPTYLACHSDDIDPIEIYAYYIGMTINNMRNGVFIDYLLSFPVTYEKAIREKILSSFTLGLRKSLPQILAEDEEFIKKEFRVISGTSEPAAYAVCALEAYGFKPKDQEEYYYGVFDFGGGTTDFDFGKWRAARGDQETDHYEHVIEHFGAGGEQFLGGENLLDYLAFTVFSSPENLPKLKKHKVYFTWPNGGAKKFSGFQDVIAKDSKWAHLNMQRMREVLRPFWERHQNYEDKFKEKQLPKMSLFTNSGDQVTDIEGLAVNLEELDQILDDKIRAGVESFMNGMLASMSNQKPRPKRLNIFLAGNSCRSEKVSKIFKEEFDKFETRYKKNLEQQGKELEESIFELFPPLGTEESRKKQEERKVRQVSDGSYAPTGKTGVAIGLLKCRTGVKVVDANKDENDEIAFKFVIGKMRGNKLIPVLTFESKLNGNWVRFILADEPEFDFYYTSKKSGLSGDLSIHETERYTCHLAKTDASASVYMRPKSPSEIEYIVARPGDVDAGRYLSETVTIKLSVGK